MRLLPKRRPHTGTLYLARERWNSICFGCGWYLITRNRSLFRMAAPLGWWRRRRLCLHDLCFRFWSCWRLGWCWWCWWPLLLCLWVLVRLAVGLAWSCFAGIG